MILRHVWTDLTKITNRKSSVPNMREKIAFTSVLPVIKGGNYFSPFTQSLAKGHVTDWAPHVSS
jgi:hypothetical protein